MYGFTEIGPLTLADAFKHAEAVRDYYAEEVTLAYAAGRDRDTYDAPIAYAIQQLATWDARADELYDLIPQLTTWNGAL